MLKRWYLEQWIVGQVLLGKLALARVPRVGLPEHGMPVSRHHLPGLQRLPDKLLQLLLGGLIAHLFPKFLQPNKYLQEKFPF